MHYIWSQWIKTKNQQQNNTKNMQTIGCSPTHSSMIHWAMTNDPMVIHEIKQEIKRFLQVNENENMTYW
jgi:hypothetical protein